MFPEYQILAGKGIERAPVHTAQESPSITAINFPVILYKTGLPVFTNYSRVFQHGLWLSHYLEIFFLKNCIFLKKFYFLAYLVPHLHWKHTGHHGLLWCEKRKENCAWFQMFGINHSLGFSSSSFVNYLAQKCESGK